MTRSQDHGAIGTVRLLARHTAIAGRTASDGLAGIVFRRRADSSVEATRQRGS